MGISHTGICQSSHAPSRAPDKERFPPKMDSVEYERGPRKWAIDCTEDDNNQIATSPSRLRQRFPSPGSCIRHRRRAAL